MSHATGLSKTEIYLDLDRPLSAKEKDVLRDAVRRRRDGEPLQYITGSAPFRYLNLKVKPGVLIPRPETEVLVSEVLSRLPKPAKPVSKEYLMEQAAALKETALNDPANAQDSEDGRVVSGVGLNEQEPEHELLVCDLCTGTGCVAISVASEHPNAHVIATDISEEAVELARENVASNSLEDRVDVIQCDLGDGIEVDLLGAFDAIISNPPYVPTEVLKSIPDEVSAFEPRLALDGGQDGLDVYSRILDWSKRALKPGGLLAVELHEDALIKASKIAEDRGYTCIDVTHDLTGRPRVITMRKKER